MGLSSMNTAAWLTFLTPLMLCITGIITIYFQQRRAERIAIATHTLVNSQHGIALATIYEQALRLASLTKAPEDVLKAENARLRLDEHEAKQAIVDNRLSREET